MRAAERDFSAPVGGTGAGVAAHREDVLKGEMCVRRMLPRAGVGVKRPVRRGLGWGRAASRAHMCAMRRSGELRWTAKGLRIAVSRIEDVAAEVAAASVGPTMMFYDDCRRQSLIHCVVVGKETASPIW